MRISIIIAKLIGKFKWLRGVTVSIDIIKKFHCNNDDNTSKNNIEEQYTYGCCFALPCNLPNILKINPFNHNIETFGENVIKNCGSNNGWYYHGGNVSSINGWIYTIPANCNRVLKFNPITNECTFIGPIFSSSNKTNIVGQRWFGGIEGIDNCIYGIPHNERGMSIFSIDRFSKK